MVVNDFKVPHSFTLGSPSKVHIQLGLAGSLGQYCEVSGLPNFHTCSVQPRALSLDLAGIMGWVHLNMEGTGRDLLDGKKTW